MFSVKTCAAPMFRIFFDNFEYNKVSLSVWKDVLTAYFLLINALVVLQSNAENVCRTVKRGKPSIIQRSIAHYKNYAQSLLSFCRKKHLLLVKAFIFRGSYS